jgi:hypothetical protein
MLDKEQKELGPPSTPSSEAGLRRPLVLEWRVVPRGGQIGFGVHWRCFLNTRVRAFVLGCFGLDNLLEFRIGEEAMVRIS